MSAKYLCIIACIILYQIFTVNAQMCPNGKNATTCVGCSDFCGASIQTTPSCCTVDTIEVIKQNIKSISSVGSTFSPLCRQYITNELCGTICTPSNSFLEVCKPFCQKISTECDAMYIQFIGRSRNCSDNPETNCFDYVIPKQVSSVSSSSITNSGIMYQFSAIVMICLSVILAVFAL